MATKETPPPPPVPEGAPPKKGKKLLIIALAAVVLLVAVAATAFVLLKPAPADDDEVAEEVDTPKKGKKKKDEKPSGPPAYLKLEAFTVNLQGESGDQFLRLELSAQFDEVLESERAKQYMPSIRNKILLLLSGKKSAELIPKEGKEKLSQEIRAEMNAVLAPPGGDKKVVGGPVRDVLFTEFVVQ